MKRYSRRTFDLRAVLSALGFAVQGIISAWKREAAFRQECLLGLVLVPLAFYLTSEPLMRFLLIGVWWWLLIVELINSAVETVVDRFDTYHPLFGTAKDIAAAAVWLSLLWLVFVWGWFLVSLFVK
jgi:diacylglycerol kinase (ATP)